MTIPKNCYYRSRSHHHLLISCRWHHAVNDLSKLELALRDIGLLRSTQQQQQQQQQHRGENDDGDFNILPSIAIEADVIVRRHSNIAVMGHPPAIDGNLTLNSFLSRLHHASFHHPTTMKTNCNEPVVLKLDFKSEDAYRLSLDDVANYLSTLPLSSSPSPSPSPSPRPSSLSLSPPPSPPPPPSSSSSSSSSSSTSSMVQNHHVWINADILSGPGYKKPSFHDPYEFVQLAITHLHGTTLSLGWTTMPTICTDDDDDDDHEEYQYTEEMITEMINVASSYPYHVTFAVCAHYFKRSWEVLQRLYYHNVRNDNNTATTITSATTSTAPTQQCSWTVTLWVSGGGGTKLSDHERRFIYETLEGDGADEKLRNRTYYDIPDFGFGKG